MTRASSINAGRRECGFSLVELVIVIVVLGILSAYAMMRGATPADLTVPSQAQRLTSDIRLAQTLAYTTGSRVQITTTNTASGVVGNYAVACVTCSNTNNFTVSAQRGVSLNGTPTVLEFNTLGVPVNPGSTTPGVPSSGGTYTFTAAGGSATVTVAALTGQVSVTPP